MREIWLVDSKKLLNAQPMNETANVLRCFSEGSNLSAQLFSMEQGQNSAAIQQGLPPVDTPYNATHPLVQSLQKSLANCFVHCKEWSPAEVRKLFGHDIPPFN